MHYNAAMIDSQSTIRDVLVWEAEAIRSLAARIGAEADRAVDVLVACQGRIIISGMGKMGWIGRKAAATFCSTGAPTIFLHPSEALHGDLGIVAREDVFVALSNSGETDELVQLMPYLKRLGLPTIALCGRPQSRLAKLCDVVVDIHVEREAAPEAPAPTASTTVCLAVCDALAVAVMRRRGFTPEQFAIFHPGGYLGRKLLLTVGQLMHTGERLPLVEPNQSLRAAIPIIGEKGLGCAFIVDSDQRLLGVLTDGDLRRIFATRTNPLDNLVGELMTATPRRSTPELLAAEALRLIEQYQITVLPVVDGHQRVVGAVHLHDLVRAGLA